MTAFENAVRESGVNHWDVILELLHPEKWVVGWLVTLP